jgi:integrase
MLLQAGIPPHVVSRRLGHASVAFTLDTYAHVLPGQDRHAVDALASAVGQSVRAAVSTATAKPSR